MSHSAPFECQQSALGGAVVCLLEGRGEGEGEGERGRGRSSEGGRARKLFSSEEREEACAGAETMQVNALANCAELN